MIIRITGGIGNQMFQYALKLKFDYLLQQNNLIDTRYYEINSVHNGYELDRVFGINADKYNGKLKPIAETHPFFYKLCFKFGIRFLKSRKRLTEIRTGFFSNVFYFDSDKCYLDGYWQSEEYFNDIEAEVRKIFKFPEFIETENVKLMKTISGQNSVSLHVRRGDYIGVSRFVALGKTEYYQNAIKYIKKYIDDPIFIVLSDDILWCKEHLDLPINTIFVDWNKEQDSYRDMQIMSNCKHNIIANSSFSWWGAWLNNNHDKIVIAPEHFFNGNIEDDKHIVPKKWIKL